MAGIAAAVLFAVATFAVPAPPDLDSASGTLEAYLSDNRSGGLLQTLAYAVAVPLVIWFVMALAERAVTANDSLRSAAGTAASIGVTLMGIAGAVFWVPVWNDKVDEEMASGIARFAWDSGYVIYLVGFGVIGLALVALGWSALRSGGLPRWLGWATAVEGVLLTVATIGIVSPGIAATSFGAFILMILWLLAGGIALVRST